MSMFRRTVAPVPDVEVTLEVVDQGIRVQAWEREEIDSTEILLGEFGLTWDELGDLAIHGRITEWAR